MHTAHYQREGAAVESRGDGEDLFRVLPDVILLKIRSMLPADAVARTRFLGRRWAKLPFLPTPPASLLSPQVWRGGILLMDLEDGWCDVLAGVAKLKSIPDASDVMGFSPDEHMHLYRTLYNMCTQKGRMDYSQALFNEHLESIVLPSLNDQEGKFLLREIVQRWEKHKLMVFNKLKSTVKTIVIGMIYDERDGKIIDCALLKNMLDIHVEIRDGQLNMNAQTCILENSYPEYILKAEECLQKEKERAVNYLPKNVSNKDMSLVNHGTNAARCRKDKEKGVMVGFPINLIGGSSIVDEILGRNVFCNPPASEYIPTTLIPHVGRVVAKENEDVVVMLSLDLAEELETIDHIYQQIIREEDPSTKEKTRKLWKFVDRGVKKCTHIRRAISLLGGSSQEIPNYLIR
uniref:Cullin N-terminal domain-containing protein n=1 Tax=Oryza punctata TaxID=4537 RepID=A0A0E0KZF6_ORYPU